MSFLFDMLEDGLRYENPGFVMRTPVGQSLSNEYPGVEGRG